MKKKISTTSLVLLSLFLVSSLFAGQGSSRPVCSPERTASSPSLSSPSVSPATPSVNAPTTSPKNEETNTQCPQKSKSHFTEEDIKWIIDISFHS